MNYFLMKIESWYNVKKNYFIVININYILLLMAILYIIYFQKVPF